MSDGAIFFAWCGALCGGFILGFKAGVYYVRNGWDKEAEK